MSTISASTTTTTAYKVTADTTGALVLQTGATPTTAVTISSAQVVTLANALAEASGGTGTTTGYYGFKNRILNGSMVIDQRNAGASVTITSNAYTLDRWLATVSASSKFSVQQNAGSITPPAGFTKYLGCTSLSAYSIGAGDYFLMRQPVEGFNTADLGWGTANAQTITVSFWVRSSLTGTFGGALENNATNRSYPFSYTISAANTWETKSITIAGDTSGTWATDNSIGVMLAFGLGVGSTWSGTAGSWSSTRYFSATGATSVVGTNGATFYITGVQLEKGSTATSFDYRPYGTELAFCQRYYEKSYNTDVAPATVTQVGIVGNWFRPGPTQLGLSFQFKVTKRITPATIVYYSPSTGASGKFQDANGAVDVTANAITSGMNSLYAYAAVASGNGDLRGHFTADSEL